MDGGVGGRRIVEGAVVVVVKAGGGGGSRGAGMGMMGMLRRHIPCSSSSRARAAGVWTRFGGSQSRHARPGCWCRVEARDSRGCDNETTLIDEASKPQLQFEGLMRAASVTLGDTNQPSIHCRQFMVVSK